MIKLSKLSILFVGFIFIGACEQAHDHNTNNEGSHAHHHHEDEDHLLGPGHLENFDLKLGPIAEKNLSNHIRTNGILTVPPQNKAVISAVIGGNIQSIMVIPGQIVKKAETLATMSHPDLISIQTDYTHESNQLEFAEKEFNRQSKLLEEEIGSGKKFQEVKTEYLTLKGRVKGIEAQLKQLHLDPDRIKNGDIYEFVPIKSPISGAVNTIEIGVGQYANPQMPLFEVIDNHHIHVDLHVYEKDISLIAEGQKVLFHLESSPDREFEATVFAIGNTFEEDTKAVSVHAEIKGDKPKGLLPGMYVSGRILLSDNPVPSLPAEAFVRDGESWFIISALLADEGEIKFEKIRVEVGIEHNGWRELRSSNDVLKNKQFVYEDAYFILSDMMEMEHDH